MFDLSQRRLYLCVPIRDDLEGFVRDCVTGGVDIVQLREKDADDETITAAARRLVPVCADLGVPFIVNDDPAIAMTVGADGVHVGQDDLSVAHCREVLGPDAIVGLSTHSTGEFDAALPQAATYLSAGPIVPTPTKPGRPGTGLDYAVASTTRSDRPVFVTGGVTDENVTSLVHAGLRHFVVVRYLTESPNPKQAAQSLRRRLDDALSAVTI